MLIIRVVICVNHTAVNVFIYLRGICVLKASHSVVPVLLKAVSSPGTQSFPGLMPEMTFGFSGGSQKHSLSHWFIVSSLDAGDWSKYDSTWQICDVITVIVSLIYVTCGSVSPADSGNFCGIWFYNFVTEWQIYLEYLSRKISTQVLGLSKANEKTFKWKNF